MFIGWTTGNVQPFSVLKDKLHSKMKKKNLAVQSTAPTPGSVSIQSNMLKI
jgi:hypothetical protein